MCLSGEFALLDNITISDKVALNFDGSCDYLDMETGQLIHHLNSRIGDTDVLFLAHFGALPVFGAKEIDRVIKKSLYYQDLSKKRP